MSVSVNTKLPAFTVATTAGPRSLSDYAGKTLVLYFYPKDSTPGCTTEGQNFAARYGAFKRANAEVLGVSRDSLASHERFKSRMEFPFELASDGDETLCRLFDVIKEKKLYGKLHMGIERSTFVVSGSGKLLQQWRGIKVPGHVEEVLEYVKGL